MAGFSRLYKREEMISKTLDIEENLYYELENLSKKVYDASINKLVNVAIEELVDTENIKLYERGKNVIYVTRTFLIRSSLLDRIYEIKERYDISIRLLINIAIRNALIEEGIMENRA